MKKIYFFFCFLLFAYAERMNAQDIHFSQITETPLMISPANAGLDAGEFYSIGLREKTN
jgi:hypothetical protein